MPPKIPGIFCAAVPVAPPLSHAIQKGPRDRGHLAPGVRYHGRDASKGAMPSLQWCYEWVFPSPPCVTLRHETNRPDGRVLPAVRPFVHNSLRFERRQEGHFSCYPFRGEDLSGMGKCSPSPRCLQLFAATCMDGPAFFCGALLTLLHIAYRYSTLPRPSLVCLFFFGPFLAFAPPAHPSLWMPCLIDIWGRWRCRV